MENRQKLINKLIGIGYLDPNVNMWGISAETSLSWYVGNNDLTFESQEVIEKHLLSENIKEIVTTDIFTKNIIEEIQHQGFWLSRGVLSPNIIYIKNCDTDGIQPHKNKPYKDIRLLLVVEHSGVAYIKEAWNATINRGSFFSKYQKNNHVFIPQQTWSWILKPQSKLDTNYEHLFQVRPISVINKLDNDMEILDFDVRGNNQGYGNYGVVGQFSASPLSVEGLKQHQNFINILKQDKRYFLNKNYIFGTIFLNGYKCSLVK